MNRKIKILFLIWLSCLAIPSTLIAAEYPSPVGYVNDFAGILPGDMKLRLEQKLSEYEKQTSIEIAVVTTKSLDDMSIEDWSIELATKWGVGKKGKDNGLVVVIAPNERKIKIEVGYGLEGDLPDGKCGRILDNFAIPNFRENNYPKGIEETVNAVMNELGTKSAEERAAERAKAEEERKQAEEKALKAFKWFGLLMLLGIVTAGFVAWIVGIRNRKLREIQRIEEMKEVLEKGIKNLPHEIAQVESNRTKASSILEEIKSENPKENWGDFVSALATIPVLLASATALLGSASKKNPEDINELTRAYEDITLAKGKLSDIEQILGSVSARQREIKEAKMNYGQNLKKAEKDVKDALELADKHKDRKEAKKKAEKAREKLEEAKRIASGDDLINWLAVALLLSAVMSLAKEAKADAVYVEEDDDDDDSSSYHHSSYHSSSYSFGSSSSSYTSRSSFGGFGGGGFGGGGASRGW
ncbi:MAG: TPM domain-containing protein [Candidatus Nanoarchaeia archaeon]|nr:TPM domain-containing protein [Candidatus Nanoarchaeia archaeon]